MKSVKVIFENKQDKELVMLTDSLTPYFVDFIDMNTLDGRKLGFKELNYWSAKKLPFVVLTEDNSETLPKVFYTEIGSNAVNQLINYLNDCKSN
jgi:hypothetical protein